MLHFGNRYFLALALGFILACSSCRLDDTTPTTEEPLVYTNLDDFFASQLAQTQVFEINNTEESSITAQEGSVLNIPASTFIKTNGAAISGNISLQVVEAFSKADFILNNKSTVSNQKLLKSAGTILIEAFSGEEKLVLNNSLSMSMPNLLSVQSPDDISLFTAEADPDFPGASVNWLLQPTDDISFMDNFYDLTLDQLDWISLSHLYDTTAETTTVKITPLGYEPFTKDQYCFIIFDDVNSVISASAPVGNVIEFSDIPIDENVTILVVAIDDFAFYIGQQSTTISADTNLDIRVQFTRESDLINTIKGFN